MTTRSAGRQPRADRESCSSSSRSRTSGVRPICSGRSTSGPAASTAGSRWRSRRCWPTTPPDASRPPPLHARAGRPNLFIKIPGTAEGLPAIEEAIFAGVPINVTLLFSREQYLAAAEAYMRGIERRIAAGLDPDVASVASVFVSRWDAAVAERVPDAAPRSARDRDRPKTYQAYRELLASPRWQRLANAGARVAATAVGQHRHQGPGLAIRPSTGSAYCLRRSWRCGRRRACRRCRLAASARRARLAPPSFTVTAKPLASRCLTQAPQHSQVADFHTSMDDGRVGGARRRYAENHQRQKEQDAHRHGPVLPHVSMDAISRVGN